ncbi:hypothetical protein DGG96_09455 [Legionella qingyii]|uniref:Uncharacterized protein n=1 Tax=Legionella qingyii TaxID=2184757 RepID=A0A317U6C2_9GAMM|nr:hypothetical protein DGG96_09455 [Legionella qingyii]
MLEVKRSVLSPISDLSNEDIYDVKASFEKILRQNRVSYFCNFVASITSDKRVLILFYRLYKGFVGINLSIKHWEINISPHYHFNDVLFVGSDGIWVIITLTFYVVVLDTLLCNY